MFLKPGCEDEYAKRHAAIWPELKQMIKDQGVSNYSIYWDKDTNILFAYQECSKDTNSQDTSDVDPITQTFNFIHASSSEGVKISNSNDGFYARRFIGVRRVL